MKLIVSLLWNTVCIVCAIGTYYFMWNHNGLMVAILFIPSAINFGYGISKLNNKNDN